VVPPPPPRSQVVARPRQAAKVEKPAIKADEHSREKVPAVDEKPRRELEIAADRVNNDPSNERVTDGPQGRKPTGQAPRGPQPAPEPMPPKVDANDGLAARAPQPSTEQLVKQAETAASRNDCAAVRVTAERIRKLDANAYKSRVANQPAIARCLR
jgi:hypothetical protein